MTQFYDAAEPANIPGGAHACLYHDGLYAATPAQAKRFAAVRWITVLGGALAAKSTGCFDWELHNANFPDPSLLVSWAQERKAMNCRARVYSDVSNLKAAWDAVGHEPNVVWWIALYGRGPLTAAQLAAAVAWAAPVPAAKMWAQQYEGDATGGVDRDVLLSNW
jgi:hypothetical protein